MYLCEHFNFVSITTIIIIIIYTQIIIWCLKTFRLVFAIRMLSGSCYAISRNNTNKLHRIYLFICIVLNLSTTVLFCWAQLSFLS